MTALSICKRCAHAASHHDTLSLCYGTFPGFCQCPGYLGAVL